MKKLFYLVQRGSAVFFLVGSAAVVLYTNGIVRFQTEAVLYAFWLMLSAPPFIIATTLVRWGTKWPTEVDWLTLAFAALSLSGLAYSARSLMYIYDDDSSVLLVKIVFPAVFAVLTGLTALMVLWHCCDKVRWLRNFFSSSPSKE